MREALFILATGEKGVGKTYKSLEDLQPYLQKRKVLIFDVNNEYGNVKQEHNPSFAHVRAIRIEDLAKWTLNGVKEARRLLPINSQGQPLNNAELQEVMGYVLKTFKNGGIILEDLTKFVSDSVGNDLIGTLATQRHASVDVFIHFQSIQKIVHPKMWALSNVIRLHRTEDRVKKFESKINNPTGLYLCENLIRIINEKNGNKRGCVYYHKESKKIKGAFDQQMFNQAIEMYLNDNPKDFKKELNKENLRTGKKIHANRNACVDYLLKKYNEDYNGMI